MFLAILSIASSCSNVTESIQKNDDSITHSQIRLENGILVLPSGETLKQVLNGQKDIPDQLFLSQKNILDHLIKEEEVYAKSLRNLSDEEYANTSRHSKSYSRLLKEGLIKIKKFQDESELYSLNLSTPNYAKVLNKEGFFAIQDTIYQITPDKLKVWMNGDINNYRLLSSIKYTDEAKNIYVFNYNEEPKNILTKAFPIVQATNQEVAYQAENEATNGRIVISFYDQTVLQLPDGFRRDIYARLSYQEKLDGRTYSFAQALYTFDLGFTFVNNTHNTLEFSSSGSDADIWYTIYFPYQFMNPGKQSQIITTSEDYWTIKSFFFIGEVYHGYPQQIYQTLDGHRQSDAPDTGNFVYSSFTGSRLLELLPE